jgi:hypothetical protein
MRPRASSSRPTCESLLIGMSSKTRMLNAATLGSMWPIRSKRREYVVSWAERRPGHIVTNETPDVVSKGNPFGGSPAEFIVDLCGHVLYLDVSHSMTLACQSHALRLTGPGSVSIARGFCPNRTGVVRVTRGDFRPGRDRPRRAHRVQKKRWRLDLQPIIVDVVLLVAAHG